MKVFDVVTVSCECGKVIGEGARNGTLNTIRVKDNRIEPHPALLLKKKKRRKFPEREVLCTSSLQARKIPVPQSFHHFSPILRAHNVLFHLVNKPQKLVVVEEPGHQAIDHELLEIGL
jgi:hypothetical protein